MAIPGSRSEPGGESPPVVPEGRDAGEYRRPAPKRGIAAQLIAPLILLTGLWVAVSPGSLPLRHAATNATTDVIIGLAVVGIGILALVSRRRSPGRQFAGLVLAVWVVLIYAFMLDARASMAAPLYWSNTWSGALVAVLALAELAKFRPAANEHAGGMPRLGHGVWDGFLVLAGRGRRGRDRHLARRGERQARRHRRTGGRAAGSGSRSRQPRSG